MAQKEGILLAINTKDIIKKFIKTEFPGKEIKKLRANVYDAIANEDKSFEGKSRKYEWLIKGDNTIIYSLESGTSKLVCDMNSYRFFNMIKTIQEEMRK